MRGLNDPIKQREVVSLVRMNKISLFGLIEHKIKEVNCPRIINSMFHSWSFAHNFANAPSGRLCIVWDPNVLTLSVLNQSSQAIHCLVQTLSMDIKFYATFVYGSNLLIERRELWHDLTNWRCLDPWVILGDFNALRYQREKIGCDHHWPPHMEELNQCIDTNDLEDLRYTGCQFTWANKQAPPAICCHQN